MAPANVVIYGRFGPYEGYERFKDITLLAAQTGFSEPGEVPDSKQMGAPAERYKPLGDAPGDYVRLR